MKQIKTTVESPYEPNDVHALWIDTSNIDSPIVRVHENGKWQGIGGDGGGSSSEETEIPVDGFAPNTYYNLGTITEDTTFLMAEGEEGKANHYFWVFETGADVPEITWPEGIRLWKDNKAPVIAANHHYEISVYDGVCLYAAIEIEVPNPYLSMPLTIEATEDGTTVYFCLNEYTVEDGKDPLKVEVSTDNGETWTEVTAALSEDDIPGAVLVTLDAGEKALLRGDNSAYGYYSDYDGSIASNSSLWADHPCYLYGNIMSLISKDGFEDLREVEDYAFADLFNSNLAGESAWVFNKEGEELLLPATTLAQYCYYELFSCSGMTISPTLPATIMAEGCYSSMFSYSQLTNAPELPATTLAEGCYNNMFLACSAITEAPELPATTLADDCYDGMFNRTSLTTAPELPATTLAEGCYCAMFYGCTSLAAAPELPATTLVGSCYSIMFLGCTSLAEVKCLATDISAENATRDWLSSVAASGTFIKATGVSWSTGESGIPSGWTVETE